MISRIVRSECVCITVKLEGVLFERPPARGAVADGGIVGALRHASEQLGFAKRLLESFNINASTAENY